MSASVRLAVYIGLTALRAASMSSYVLPAICGFLSVDRPLTDTGRGTYSVSVDREYHDDLGAFEGDDVCRGLMDVRSGEGVFFDSVCLFAKGSSELGAAKVRRLGGGHEDYEE